MHSNGFIGDNFLGQCTASCGSGQRSRDVKCLDSNKRPSSGCTISTKPPVREPCKRRDCPSLDEAKPNPPGNTFVFTSEQDYFGSKFQMINQNNKSNIIKE